MSRNKNKDTALEILIRKAIHAKGFRYKLHDKKLPGKPDLVFPKYKAVIFINGCFWHGHGCSLFKWPATNEDFWKKKISGNQKRDLSNIQKLKSSGWKVLTVWECSTRGVHKIGLDASVEQISDWLQAGTSTLEITEKSTDD